MLEMWQQYVPQVGLLQDWRVHPASVQELFSERPSSAAVFNEKDSPMKPKTLKNKPKTRTTVRSGELVSRRTQATKRPTILSYGLLEHVANACGFSFAGMMSEKEQRMAARGLRHLRKPSSSNAEVRDPATR